MSSPRFAAAPYFTRLFDRLEDQETAARRETRISEQEDFRRHILLGSQLEQDQLILRTVESEEVLKRYQQVAAEHELRVQGPAKKHISQTLDWLQHRGEKAARVQLLSKEGDDHDDMMLREGQNLAGSAVAELPREEHRWRHHLTHSEDAEFRQLLGAVIAPVLMLFLTSKRGTHSEPNYRTLITVQERKHRVALATRYCSLHLQWAEQWGRIKVRFCQRTCFEHLMEAGHKVMRQEALEREEFRILYEPVAEDIREQIESVQHLVEKRERKLVVLKQLREVELQRMMDTEMERADYVSFWKADELLKIQEAQEAIVKEVAMAEAHNPSPTAEGGEPCWERLSRAFEQDLATLTIGGGTRSVAGTTMAGGGGRGARQQQQQQQPISFSEIVNYRKRLLHFDDFISCIEGAVSNQTLDEQLDRLNAESAEQFEGHFAQLEDNHDKDPNRALVAYPNVDNAGKGGRLVKTSAVHEHSNDTGRDLLEMLHQGYGWSDLKQKKLKERNLALHKRGGGPASSAALAEQRVPMIAAGPGPSSAVASVKEDFDPTTVTPQQLAAAARSRNDTPPAASEAAEHFDPNHWVKETAQQELLNVQEETEERRRNIRSRNNNNNNHSQQMLLQDQEATARSQNKVHNAIHEIELEKAMDAQLDGLHSWMNSNC